MRPLDPRLLRYARSTRGFLILAVVLGAAIAALVIAQARLLSTVIVDVAQGGADLYDVAGVLALLATVFGVRALLGWLAEAAAYRTSARAKEQLRESAMRHVLALGPQGPAGHDPGAVAALVTRGVDALDSYFARYLPQLVLAVIVPAAVFVTILGQDLVSALIIAITLPLIPVFMILIGLYTRSRVERQWETLSRLSGHFLDLVAGLPALKVFGRARMQAQAIEAIGERYRTTTMGVLRITFLSSFALELLASLSVALVAVTVGVRLAEGGISFSAALFILILAPEAYLPIRLVGQHFHAAAEGLGAAEEVFILLEQPLPSAGERSDIPTRVTINLDQVSVEYPDRDGPALAPTTASASPGQIVALVGPSGGGKSTLLSLLLGFAAPTSGRILLTSDDAPAMDLTDVDMSEWRRRIGWVPQDPHLVVPGVDRPTIAEAVRMGAPNASISRIQRALGDAGALAEFELLPDGLDTPVHELSSGQRRRTAVARALVRDPQVLLLDEPTAALDGVSEQAVVDAIVRARSNGCTVIAVAHRPALVDIADVVVHVGGSPAGTSRNLSGQRPRKITTMVRDF
ncbi:MAG: thiol reductant ABC exporter subunit CydD [Candidatus Nanopelagicales bacterium]